MSYDIDRIRADFPATSLEVHGKPLVYLDNGASAQKPQRVIDANVHRGLHYLSNLATENYEAARGVIQHFLNAAHEDEIVFTRGSTEALNLIAYGWAEPRIKEGDEIVLSTMEHHANIVPWHFLRERFGAKLVWVSMARKARCICRSMCRRLASISTASPATSFMAPLALVRCMASASAGRRCVLGMAAAI